MNAADILPYDAPDVHKRLLGMWVEIAQKGAPKRYDFDFTDLFADEHEAYEVIQQTPETGSSRYVLGRVSKEAQNRLGRSLPGEDLANAFAPRLYGAVAENYRASIESGQPHYWERCSSFYGNPPDHYKRLLLPLVDDHGERGWLLSSMVWPFHTGF